MLIALIISALALSFTFAPFGARFLAYFALIPLILVIHRYNYKKTFLYSLLFGSVFAMFHLWWLYFLIIPVEPATRILLILGVTILFVYLGMYAAVFSVVTKYLGLAFAPLVWAVLEFVRTKSEIGFPWGLLGNTQTSYTSIIQMSSIFGVYGLSAWVVWINLLLFWIFKKKHKFTYIVLLIVSMVVPICLGIIRIQNSNLKDNLKIAMVQPNVGANEKGDVSTRNRLIFELDSLVRESANAKPDLIICPETATIIDITRNQDLQNRFQQIADSNNVSIFTGTPQYERGSPIYYNSAVLFEPNKVISDSVVISDTVRYFMRANFDKIYKKIHLVPFSERIPYADRIALIKKIETGDMGSCTPGKEYTVFEIPNPKSQIPNKFAALICFESIFPDLAREFTIRGADMLVNITNDGWFGKTPGPHQHCELAILRSVENGVPLVRVANNGISLIADPFGRVTNKTKLSVQTVVLGNVSEPTKPTIYRRFGDFFIYLALAVMVIAVIARPFRRIRR